LGLAILEGGGREYWLTVTVRCIRCGATYVGEFPPVGSDGEPVASWELLMDNRR
jgi:hypothetical protein